ncbi:MAG: hypothetical protein QXD19_05150, partial [Candidatus Bathyarchaeia archaeon]
LKQYLLYLQELRQPQLSFYKSSFCIDYNFDATILNRFCQTFLTKKGALASGKLDAAAAAQQGNTNRFAPSMGYKCNECENSSFFSVSIRLNNKIKF